MPSVPSNPDLLLRHFEWRNRVELWRSQPAETAFTGFAVATFIGLGLWIADPRWTGLLQTDAVWARPLPAALLALTLTSILVGRAYRHRQALSRGSDDWLAAMPIPPRMRQQARRQHVSRAALMSALVMIGLGAWAAVRAQQPAIGLVLALVVGALIGVLASWFLPEPRMVAAAQAR